MELGSKELRAYALPAISTGTMVEPYYDGEMYYLAQKGQIIKLTVEPDEP